MSAEVNRPHSFAATITQIPHLPTHARVNALMDLFAETLKSMDPDTIRTLRDQVMERFSSCGGDFETCQLMIEFIDVHLALRASARRRHVTGAR